jgi:hypothetical protein
MGPNAFLLFKILILRSPRALVVIDESDDFVSRSPGRLRNVASIAGSLGKIPTELNICQFL